MGVVGRIGWTQNPWASNSTIHSSVGHPIDEGSGAKCSQHNSNGATTICIQWERTRWDCVNDDPRSLTTFCPTIEQSVSSFVIVDTRWADYSPWLQRDWKQTGMWEQMPMKASPTKSILHWMVSSEWKNGRLRKKKWTSMQQGVKHHSRVKHSHLHPTNSFALEAHPYQTAAVHSKGAHVYILPMPSLLDPWLASATMNRDHNE